MKLFSWMQSKFSSGHGDKRANALPPTDNKNEESRNGLLSIGTLGYKDEMHKHFEGSLDSGCNFSAEEVRRLQNELTKLLNCPYSYSHNKDIDRTIRIILGRCKDACQKKRAISLSFLVRKLFLCTTPSLRDAFQESRMEKLMRAMLANKIHPRNSYGASSTIKSIEDYRHVQNAEHDQRLNDRNSGGFKWDNTDSEFIVLEI